MTASRLLPFSGSGFRRKRHLNRLWQHIFACTLLLVLVSQLAVFTLFYVTQDRDYRKKWLAEYVGSLVRILDGEGPESATVFLRHINRSGPRMWFEDENGVVLLGESRPGYTLPERALFVRVTVQRGKVAITDTPMEGRTTFCRAPVHFDSGLAYLCYAFPGYDSATPISDIFYQGFAVLLVVGGMMSLWIARVVASPLLAMRGETLVIADGALEKRVTSQGYDEIIDMAEAVNKLTENLLRHITGMRTLLANISHEMRSPLTRMELYATMLEEGLKQQSETLSRNAPPAAHPRDDALPGRTDMIRSNLRLIQEEIRLLEGIVDTSLQLGKLDLQANADSFEPVAFSDLCADAARRFEAVFTAKDIRFDIGIALGLAVNGDEDLLCHAIFNLLDNAVKYTPRGGRARLTLLCAQRSLPGKKNEQNAEDSAPAMLELQMANTHAPIPEEKLSRLFEPFYRAGIATGNGVGLGLSLVRRIIALHGGESFAQTSNLDNEACLCMVLRLPPA
jgi:signal transduction histidine kinase